MGELEMYNGIGKCLLWPLQDLLQQDVPLLVPEQGCMFFQLCQIAGGTFWEIPPYGSC